MHDLDGRGDVVKDEVDGNLSVSQRERVLPDDTLAAKIGFARSIGAQVALAGVELADKVEAMADMFAANTDTDSILAIGDELGAVLLAPRVENTSPYETAPDLADCNRSNDGDTVLVVELLLFLECDQVGCGEDAPCRARDSAAGDGRAVCRERQATPALGKGFEVFEAQPSRTKIATRCE